MSFSISLIHTAGSLISNIMMLAQEKGILVEPFFSIELQGAIERLQEDGEDQTVSSIYNFNKERGILYVSLKRAGDYGVRIKMWTEEYEAHTGGGFIYDYDQN